MPRRTATSSCFNALFETSSCFVDFCLSLLPDARLTTTAVCRLCAPFEASRFLSLSLIAEFAMNFDSSTSKLIGQNHFTWCWNSNGRESAMKNLHVCSSKRICLSTSNRSFPTWISFSFSVATCSKRHCSFPCSTPSILSKPLDRTGMPSFLNATSGISSPRVLSSAHEPWLAKR